MKRLTVAIRVFKKLIIFLINLPSIVFCQIPADFVSGIFIEERIRSLFKKAKQAASKGDPEKAYFYFKVGFKISRRYLRRASFNANVSGGYGFPLILKENYYNTIAYISLSFDGMELNNGYFYLTLLSLCKSREDYLFLLMETSYINAKLFGFRKLYGFYGSYKKEAKADPDDFILCLCRMGCYQGLGNEEMVLHYRKIIEEMIADEDLLKDNPLIPIGEKLISGIID